MRFTSTFAVVSLSLLAGCEVAQPSIGCPVQRITWAARFNLVEGQAAVGDCTLKGGELLGIQKFVPASGPDQLVIKPLTLAALDDGDPEAPPYSQGTFASEPDADDFCAATELTVARKAIPEEGVDVAYQWTEVKILSRPNAPGSQLAGRVNYTEGGCTAEYEVWAQWPAVFCDDEEGNPSDAICGEEGHGLNLEFASVCDPTTLRCVPAQRPPSFR